MLSHDLGLNPCIEDGVLSFALCCPQIRNINVNRGDYLMGMASTNAQTGFGQKAGLVVFVARVGDTKCPIEYHATSCRPDSIYDVQNGVLVQKKHPDPFHNPDDENIKLDYLRKDSTGNVLLSTHFARCVSYRPIAIPEDLEFANCGNRTKPKFALTATKLRALEDLIISIAKQPHATFNTALGLSN